MSKELAIKVDNISKRYRLGVVGSKTIREDVKNLFKKIVRKNNSINVSTEVNDRTVLSSKSEYVWSLRNVNFEIQRGDVIGIIGRNGAGKSTLLKILSRITAPTEGEIKINGKIASLLEVGTGFHPELTGRENIYLNGSILGMTKGEINRKIDAIIDFAEIQRYVDTPVKRYSSGMYVRLAFSIAAHLEPDILIVDEVLAVGDTSFQRKCINKMSEISKKDGRTILFVSHQMATIQSLCSKTILLENGSVKFHGNVEDGIELYLSTNKDKSNSLSIENSLNRTGSGKVIFSNFHFETNEGVEIDTVLTGQEMVLVFKLLNKTEDIVENVNVGFSLHDNHEIGLANIYSSYQKENFTLKKGYNEIRFKLRKVNVTPGSLIVKGRIEIKNEESDCYLDNLGSIMVEMGDFYNTGQVGQINWGKFLIEGTWSKL